MEVKCSCCEESKCSTEYYKDKRSKKGSVRQPCKVCIKLKEKLKREEYSSQEKCIPKSKVCSGCKEEKLNSDFHKRKDTPTGLRDRCKVCYNKASRTYYEDNKDSVLKRTSEWAKENREKVNENKRSRYDSDPEKYKSKSKEYREANKIKIKRWSSEYRKQPHIKVKLKAYDQEYRKDPLNKERRKETNRVWNINNKDKVCYYSSSRRARLKDATPLWADTEIIKSFYTEAQYFSESIDHIVPLTHPLVCGLHCEFNLQLMSLKDNISKNNNFEPCEHELPVSMGMKDNTAAMYLLEKEEGKCQN